MLPIILLILKIIGMIILTVLGLLLFLLLILLLIPVRYQLRATHGENLYLKGRVSWLLHLVHISVTHMEGVLHIRARVLGFIIYDNLNPKKPKKKKTEKVHTKQSLLSTGKEKANDIQRKQIPKVNEKIQTGSSFEAVIKEVDIEKAKDNAAELYITEKDQSEINKAEGSIAENNKAENSVTENSKVESNLAEKNIAKSNIVENNKTEYSNAEIREAESKETEDRESTASEKVTMIAKLYHKAKVIWQGWKETYRKLRNGLRSIRESIRSKSEKLVNIIKGIRHKWELIYSFWMDELNKQGMKYILQSMKKLLKHILPTKLKSELIIGTGEPYSTGQVLSIINLFYGFYGDKVSVTPDFENSRFEGKHYAKGRIRAATILIIACRLILDKRFKYLKNNFLILKEALQNGRE